MALVFNRDSTGVSATGTVVTVPDHPKAKLMYYLNCMCTVLSLDQAEHNIARLTDYRSYYILSDEETAAMVVLCTLLDPDTLNGVCILDDEEACGDSSNEFFEINARRTTVPASESVMVGNVRVPIKKIMCYKMNWLEENYIEPLSHFVELYQNGGRNNTPRRRRPTTQNSEDSCCCNIL